MDYGARTENNVRAFGPRGKRRDPEPLGNGERGFEVDIVGPGTPGSDPILFIMVEARESTRPVQAGHQGRRWSHWKFLFYQLHQGHRPQDGQRQCQGPMEMWGNESQDG